MLFAPVPITPTKPLTPSHIKGLLWADVISRATAVLADVDHLHSHTVAVANAQTLGFWAHLDAHHPGLDFSGLDEEHIGSLYVEFQRRRDGGAFGDLSAYHEAVARDGWLHPASSRVLDLWTRRWAELGMRDPGLTARRPPPATADEVLDLLARRGLCIDHRPSGGPVYLDATRHGLPLRQIMSAGRHANYLLGLLRELAPLVGSYDSVVLACDREAVPDYTLLAKVLTDLGAAVTLVGIGRVRLGGDLKSSRHGGWEGRTAAHLAEEFLPRVGPAIYRLGVRLYYIAVLGQGDREPFRPQLLWRCMARAKRLLDRPATGTGADLPEFLARHARPHPHVDPYRLTTALLTRNRPAPGRELLEKVLI